MCRGKTLPELVFSVGKSEDGFDSLHSEVGFEAMGAEKRADDEFLGEEGGARMISLLLALAWRDQL